MIVHEVGLEAERYTAGVPKTRTKEKGTARGELIHGRLSAICLSLPGTTETFSWGHPNYRAGGKAFATLESFKGVLSIAVRASEPERELLLDDPRFFPTPYSGGRGWVSLKIEGRIPWTLVRQLCVRAHALATQERKPSQRKRSERG